MPTTPVFGFVYGNETDTPDMVALDEQALLSVENMLVTAGWFAPSAYFLLRTSGNSLTVAQSAPTLVGVYDGGSTSVGSRITFASGVLTVLDAGLYEWYGQMSWPIGTGVVATQAEVNGSVSNEGRLYTTQGAHSTQISTVGWLILNAGDQVQFAPQALDGALTANPLGFGLTRIA